MDIYIFLRAERQGDNQEKRKMSDKKRNFNAFAVGAGKTAVEILNKAKEKTVQIIDQNDDGKIDIADMSEIASTMSEAAKRTANNVRESANEKARQMELKALQPIFAETLDDADYTMTKLIRICEKDKKRMESEVCQNSIGYYTETKGLRVVNIYCEYLDLFDITLYPDNSYEFYYIDPTDRDRYIALDEYFSYLKVARVSELQKLAQQLGAKHFRVTYKEEKMSFSSRKSMQSIHAENVIGAASNQDSEKSKYSTVDIAAEFECDGHDPITPELRYLQKDENIQNLIHMRMHEQAPLKHQRIMIKLSNSSGIKESDAIKIDAVLKGLKCTGNASVTNEAKNEMRRYLEYEIDF